MKKMTDSENKYEQRVRQRAEEFAKINRTERARKQYPWERLNDSSKEAHIKWMTPIARLSVQREAEAYSQGYANVGLQEVLHNTLSDRNEAVKLLKSASDIVKKCNYPGACYSVPAILKALFDNNVNSFISRLSSGETKPDTCANLASQLKKAMPETYPGKAYQPFFDHMSKEHNLTLLESEMQEIIEIVRKMDSPWISVEDRLPERGQIVDIYCMGEDKYCTARITRSDVKDFITWSKATHWRPQTPLPAPPESLTDKP